MSYTFIGDPSVPLEDDDVATLVGAALISTLHLNLRYSKVDTSQGPKTPAGLARLVWETIEKGITHDQ